MKSVLLQGEAFVLDSSGALYWQDKKTLLVADVHLGKVSHFRKNGVAVPRKAEGVFYQKIAAVLQQYAVTRIVFLGDLFHSFQNNEWFLFEAWVKKQTAELILVEGNHDVIPKAKFHALGVQTVSHWKEGPFYFTHFPENQELYTVICGHLHPGIRLHGKGKQQLRLPCFYLQPKQLILPAFGSFTGLHLVQPQIGDQVFVITAEEVFEIPIKT
jgi:DNA ligase-associated metallophosphoesterase